ncbi:MAG: hypothetical protein IJU99_00545 [Lachnospiraceae bacterium]|nr:hypothetical protein [Lachnospiraceae bacterium]
MLDEIREWEQCALPREGEGSFRMKHRNISSDLSGIDRAFTVIARRFLCGAEGEPDLIAEVPGEAPGEALARRIGITKQVLRAWCGYEQEMPEGLTAAGVECWEKMRNRLTTGFCEIALEQADIRENKNYEAIAGEIKEILRETLKACSNHVGLAEATEAFERIDGICREFKEAHDMQEKQMYAERILHGGLEALAARERGFGMPAVTEISFDLNAKMNTFKLVNYERACAAALDLGMLRRYVVLSCGGDFTGGILRPTAKKVKPISKTDLDTVPRVIFAWLMERTRHGGGKRRAEVLNTADVINWCKGTPHLEKSKRELFLYGKEPAPLFQTPAVSEEDKGDNVIKICLHPEFFDRYAERLAVVPDREEEIRAWVQAHPEGAYVLWRDRGSGCDLEMKTGDEIPGVSESARKKEG